MKSTGYFKDQFRQLQETSSTGTIAGLRKEGFEDFSGRGLPSFRDEEWKYTNISTLFQQEYTLDSKAEISPAELDAIRLPGHEQASELVFVNGIFNAEYSSIRSGADELIVMPLQEAAEGSYKDLVKLHLNQSASYIKDGIQALNTAMIYGGLFVHVLGRKEPLPVYVYHILKAETQPVLAQPRSLVYAGKGSQLQLTESYTTIGNAGSLNNQVMEVVVAENAYVEYYKLQNDNSNASQVSTSHIRQIGRSYVHTVSIALNGGMVRNNINLILDAEGNESHMYGLYLLKGKTHVDNHTLIDNRKPNCFSNQLYKGIADDSATAVFNGRIMVQPDAQKTNAYQANKNILRSDLATINAKPQLEIFADDVKCSHGCTVGQLDQEALFYLRARGISKEKAEVMLLQAFAADILVQIKPRALREHAEKLIDKHLSF